MDENKQSDQLEIETLDSFGKLGTDLQNALKINGDEELKSVCAELIKHGLAVKELEKEF